MLEKKAIIWGIGILCIALIGTGLILHFWNYSANREEAFGTSSNMTDSARRRGDTEPGQGDTEPGQGDTEPGQGDTEPGQGDTESGQGDTEPGQGDTEPGQGDTEPGQGDTEPGQGQKEAESGQAQEELSYNQTEPTREEFDLLQADVVIDPAATVSALAMETVAEVDLDGDGVTELLQVGVLGEDGNPPYWETWEPYRAAPAIRVDRKLFAPDAVGSVGVPGREDLDVATYYILDIDVNDPYREIGIYYQGYGVSPRIYLLRYGNDLLTCIGSMGDVYPISLTQSCSAEEWQLEVSENPDAEYQKMLDAVDRDEILLTVPGDGTITAEGFASGYCRSVQDEKTQRMWELQGAEDFCARLVERELEVYEFLGWSRDWGDNAATTNKELQIYADKNTEADVITIPAGTKISFCSYCPEGGWIRMAYGSSEQSGWFQLEQMLAGSTGNSSYYYKNCLVMPNGRFFCSDVLENLQFIAGR